MDRKPHTLVISILTSAFLFLPLSCNGKKQAEPLVPQATISATMADKNVLEVRIQIPAGHHAYLNRGDENNLIPVEFFWDDLLAKKLLSTPPRKLSVPAGERDEEFKAQVLRNEGVYTFQLPADRSLKGEALRIRYQICNEAKGICYRPTNANVLIR